LISSAKGRGLDGFLDFDLVAPIITSFLIVFIITLIIVLYALSNVKCLMHVIILYNPLMNTLSERLKKARLDAGYDTARIAAERMGVSYDTYVQHENGTRGFPAKKAEFYAKAFNISFAWLMTGKGDARNHLDSRSNNANPLPQTRTVPIVGDVQAGAWIEPMPDIDEAVEHIPFTSIAYRRSNAFALRVKGTSMNKVFEDGTIVIAIPLSEAGLREGDYVILRRFDALGKCETTLKQAVKGKKSLEFWPRSTDPRYQAPFMWPDHQNMAETDFHHAPIVLIGIVVASYNELGLRTGEPINL